MFAVPSSEVRTTVIIGPVIVVNRRVKSYSWERGTESFRPGFYRVLRRHIRYYFRNVRDLHNALS